MIARWSAAVRRLRRRFGAPERLVRRLGLPTADASDERGLILVQIDGLSRHELEHALRRGRMPFLGSLLAREGYHLHTHYSGIPSTTPAVQGELFFGVPQCVPAFGFRDRQSKTIVRMLEPETAARVEQQLSSECASPLMAGGSSYSNVFTGGAAEPHFSPAALGDGKTTWISRPGVRARLLLGHLPSMLRMVGLAAVEFGLAIADMLRGAIAGRDLWGELKYVPKRVAVSVVLRDLMTIGACVDATRGLPVVQLNYLGYDEQAHRRGPASSFAHWSLKGIDASIKRVWRAAHASPREYDVWVYSDHGHQRTISYAELFNRPLIDAINIVLQRELNIVATQDNEAPVVGGQRASWLRSTPLASTPASFASGSSAQVVGMGPLGYIYFPRPLSPAEEQRVASALVRDAGIPLVLARTADGKAIAWKEHDCLTLPEDAAHVLGAEHPFLQTAATDLAALCHHPDAGDLMISGWRLGEAPLSFPMERGAHGGPGPQETGAFALLPHDAPVVLNDTKFLRPVELRQAALIALGRAPRDSAPVRPSRRQRGQLRLVTYNVHRCLGMDGKLSPDRIARVLAHCDADVIALQELDVRRRRTGNVDQVHAIAQRLRMDFHFHPAITIEEEAYGDAILSRLPLRLVRSAKLPSSPSDPQAEPRGAIWVEVDVDGQPVQIINTHLGLGRRERLAQVAALLGSEWLGDSACREPVVLCGDFNAVRFSVPYRQLTGRLRDAQFSLPGHRRRATWSSNYPLVAIDHVFCSGEIEVKAVEVARTSVARLASDHLPLIVDLAISAN
jgi:endonuclease/exonuclease/phosphatase family metal-dependent hydrolase